MLSQGEFLGYEDKVDIKILKRVFCSQGSGVWGWGSGVKTWVTSWSNLEKSQNYSKSWYLTPVLTPEPWPMTPTTDPWLQKSLLSILAPFPPLWPKNWGHRFNSLPPKIYTLFPLMSHCEIEWFSAAYRHEKGSQWAFWVFLCIFEGIWRVFEKINMWYFLTIPERCYP